MIDTIGSLVQETSNRWRWLTSTTLYIVACLSTAALLGALLSILGRIIYSVGSGILPHALMSMVGTGFVGFLALAYALSDVGTIRLPYPRLMYAVPVTWWRLWKPYGAALAYGAALGLGVMTRVQFGAFYVLAAWCVLQGNVVYGVMLMGIYGAGRALIMLPASWGVYRRCTSSKACLQNILAALGMAKIVVALPLALFSAHVLVSLLF